MTTWAITGVSGYLGGAVLARLAGRPDLTIVGLDLRPPPNPPANLVFYQRDVRDPTLVDVLEAHAPDALLHLAAVLDPLYDDAREFSVDVLGTDQLLRAAAAAGVPHVVATSSGTVYGAHADNPVPLTEDAPLRPDPRFRYAYCKRLGEERLAAFARAQPDVTVTVVRPCIVLGPNVANYIVIGMLAPPFVALLDGRDPEMQFVHESDVADFLVAALDHPVRGALNLAGTGTVRLRELARLTERRALPVPNALARGFASLLWHTRLLPQGYPPASLDFFRFPWVLATARSEQELGFRPRYSSRECVEQAFAHREQIFAAHARRRADGDQSSIGAWMWRTAQDVRGTRGKDPDALGPLPR